MKAVFTICTPGYFAHAKTLFQSFSRFNSGYAMYLCVFNLSGYDFKDYFEPLGVHIINIEAIGIAEYKKMRAQYDSFELSCALKPFVAQHICSSFNPKILLYFDCDILITNSLQVAEASLVERDILITPHFTQLPLTMEENQAQRANRLITERSCLPTGMYNGGFWGIKNSVAANSFIAWWQNALVDGCYNNIAKGLYTDQLWLNILPIYFTHALCVLKNPGYNAAYWNLHERTLACVNYSYVVNGQVPLVFFHFSGFKSGTQQLTMYNCAYTLDNRPDIKPLFLEYEQLLFNNGHAIYKQIKIPGDKAIHKKRKINHYLQKLRLAK